MSWIVEKNQSNIFLVSTLLTTALSGTITPDLPVTEVDFEAPLGSDIIYTPYQIEKLEEGGFDTSNYEKGVSADVPWRAVWQNPDGYSGSDLIIPYRFQQQGAYTSTQEKDIEDWLNELSTYMNGCVSFVNDTKDKKYSKDYIYIRNIDDNGNRLKDPFQGFSFLYWTFLETRKKGVCNSNIGNITKYYKRDKQDLNLSVSQPDYKGHCIHRKTVQHEMMHALGRIRN